MLEGFVGRTVEVSVLVPRRGRRSLLMATFSGRVRVEQHLSQRQRELVERRVVGEVEGLAATLRPLERAPDAVQLGGPARARPVAAVIRRWAA